MSGTDVTGTNSMPIPMPANGRTHPSVPKSTVGDSTVLATRAGIWKEQVSGTGPVARLSVGLEARQDWSIGRWSKSAMTLTRLLTLAPCGLPYGR